MKTNFKLYGYISKGYEGQPIIIETDIRNGFPGFDIIGLPDGTIKESRQRVKTALINSGFRFPQQKVLVSLSPASEPKSGSLLDLGIALSILVSSHYSEIKPYDGNPLLKIVVAGELMLDGSIVKDALSNGAINLASEIGAVPPIVPLLDKSSFLEKQNSYNVGSLTEAYKVLLNILKADTQEPMTLSNEQSPIFSHVFGLEDEKETMCIVASGFHSLLMFGPPGTGKTMMEERLGLLLPDLSSKEIGETKRNWEIGNKALSNFKRPIRSLSHDSSPKTFTVGPRDYGPGDGALAHNGLLVLDEITSYNPRVLNLVREAYDNGKLSNIKNADITFPARFLMVGSMNPCPCGGLGTLENRCTCSTLKIDNHWKYIGSPLIERFDIRIPFKVLDFSNALFEVRKPDSYYIDKINLAFQRQKQRFKDTNISFNGQLHYEPSLLYRFKSEFDLYNKIIKGPISTRVAISAIGLSRTIADLEDTSTVKDEHMEKALSFKQYGMGDYFWKVIN